MANDAASEARQKLLDAVKAKKSFAASAKDIGLTTREIPNFSQAEPPVGVEDSNAIRAAVNGVQSGDLSRVVPKQDGSGYLLAFVDKIELYEDSSKESAEKILGSQLNREDQTRLFEAWFNQRRKEAGAERDPNRRIIEPGQPST